MNHRIFPLVLIFILSGLFLIIYMVLSPQQDQISFNQDIRPILNDNCLACHGGVKKESGFSLLFEEEAFSPNESGKVAIIPGKPAESELYKRINHHDPELRMPPQSDPLDPEQVELIRNWIRQGAQWETHWALIPPQKQDLPRVKSKSWGQNDIDYFILDKLEDHDLKPSSAADKPTLLRRLSLDLVGLPPVPEQMKAFLQDPEAHAYEKQVDRLLASPHFGEKWASMWLDLARYADSKGYEKDGFRSIWKFRDYVIHSLNQDKPFDQFTIEQLAGDLLSDPTEDQLIATAFHRNTMNNDEGGTEDEEFRVASVIDRVNTTFEVWQGLTMSCVQCHSHPYDPFRHREYYELMAFFNNTADADVPSESPNLKIFEPDDRGKLEQIKKWVYQQADQNKAAWADYFTNLVRITEPKIHPNYFDSITNGTLADAKYMTADHNGFCRIRDVFLTDREQVLISYASGKRSGRVEFRLDSLTGRPIAALEVQDTGGGWRFKTTSLPIEPVDGFHDIYLAFIDPGNQGRICQIEWLLFSPELPGIVTEKGKAVKQDMMTLLNSETTNTPIMMERPDFYSRNTHLFERGNWLVKGEQVEAGVPASMPGLSDYPSNRLGLAQWLVDPANPLTARVMVNRVWEQLFGIGIIETAEDFGTQGTPPSHPALLDHLSYLFVHEFDWSLKRLIKNIVMSATYRQDSRSKPQLNQVDPYNRLLARGPRFRLSAEQVRDQALAVGGLLSSKIGGPSVMPPQPEGVWQVIYSGNNWETAEGEDRYRRGLYTFWRRTTPYPSMVSFDAPSREFCVSRRIRTNTPLQAFVTLNDTVYFEAALALAEKMMQKGDSPEQMISAGYFQALLKEISPAKLESLLELYHGSLNTKQEQAPLVKPTSIKNEAEQEQFRALTMVANVILNLDEFLTKE
ncbi:MAG: DUF1553 domain-containing protein [Candidatus Cyclobacteriaceae bacterium M3_2C_046]